MASEAYQKRIESYMRRHPEATRAEARGHAPVIVHEKDKEHPVKSYERKSYGSSIRTLKPMMEKVKNQPRVLLIIHGCVTCPSGGPDEGEEGVCGEGAYEEVMSHWVQTATIQMDIQTQPDMSLVDFANIRLPIYCWPDEKGEWLSVFGIQIGEPSVKK